MAELALYRKYRSASFDEVLGQPHIVRTLTQALASGKVSHAYLFTGPRGTGKTSVARLLAKSLNDSELDTIEIDAASNRSIDAVRELRERVNLAPSAGQYKIYIIDEVHMLTTEAFNALLKTIEEPPPHAIFILATTEAHKVPETIVSRTQRFAFKPIGSGIMVERLQHIAASEKIEVEPAALELIAVAARGGLRDAISLFDQATGGTKGKVTLAEVRQLLGYGDTAALTALATAVADRHPKAALEVLDGLMASGVQPGQLVLQLVQWWRELLLISTGVHPSDDEAVTKLAARLPLGTVAGMIEQLLEAARSPQPAVALEVAVTKMALGSQAATAAPAPAPNTSPVRPPAAAKVEPRTPAKPESAPASDLSADLWPKVLLAIKTQNNSLYALLRSCHSEFTGNGLTIWTKFNFHRDRLREAKNRQIIEDSLQKVYGRPVLVTVEVETASRPAASADANADLVSSALEILGGEIVD